jgi:hypothetical protein
MASTASRDDVTDPARRPDDTPTREWVKAALVVGLGAVLTTALVAWLALAFVFGSCCVAPSPGA